MVKSKQLSIADIYQELNTAYDEQNPAFVKLLEDNLDISQFIPASFYEHFYKHFGRKRKYSLESFILAFVIQLIFSIPTTKLLRQFLVYSKPLRDLCGFDTVPDEGKFSRFKHCFDADFSNMFDGLVEVTEPICQKISPELSSELIFDTTGTEAYVTENNPKYFNKILNRQKAFAKANPNLDPYKSAYSAMPKQAFKAGDVKLMYINGHFCYAHKYGILTNGLGIARAITPLDSDFKSENLSPDDDKSVGDNTALKPVLETFFTRHPSFSYESFLGDSAFDAIETYSMLLQDFGFKKAFIPLNPRAQKYENPGFDELGCPFCGEASLPFKYEGRVCGKDRPDRDKWVCPLSFTKKGKRGHSCKKPCTASPCGRMIYTYPENDLRMYPGVIRSSDEWLAAYKNRAVVERTINQFKEHMGVGNVKSRDRLTSNSGMYLAGITQLLTLVLADRLYQENCDLLKLNFRSLKRLIA